MPQLVVQIPWGHIRLILDKIKDRKEAEFYIRKTIENSWSRVILEHQIALNSYHRQGKVISNFESTIDTQDITLIKESFKEEQEFFIDLLFYNYILKRFVIIELKTTEFKPEYVGQIGFYITAIDRDIKEHEDKSTIGLIICKSKNNTVVEYALANSNMPTGVAEYKLLSELPEEIQKYLPTQNELKSL